jgi:rare lipoprotein A
VVQRSAAVPATTVTVPPTTTTTEPSVVTAGSVHYGQVTYYAHPAGTCASPFLAFGTVVRVTNPANGLSITCLVNDREADTARSIDLATATFAELAPLSQGVIDAQLTW